MSVYCDCSDELEEIERKLDLLSSTDVTDSESANCGVSEEISEEELAAAEAELDNEMDVENQSKKTEDVFIK